MAGEISGENQFDPMKLTGPAKALFFIMYKNLFAEANLVKDLYPKVKDALFAAQEELMRVSDAGVPDHNTKRIIKKLSDLMYMRQSMLE